MADFLQAFERMIRNEGGYVLHTVPGDHGGQTYAGISRRAHPEWEGWPIIAGGSEPPAEMVRSFYRHRYWTAIRGDEITDQRIAQAIFDFAVNAGVKTALVLAQTVVGTTPDGVIGAVTLAALNQADPEHFLARYALARIARYAAIVTRDKSQAKFLLGWVNRTLREVSS